MCKIRGAIDAVHPTRRELRGAIYAAPFMWCEARGVSHYVVQSLWCELRGVTYMVQSMWCNTSVDPRCCAPPMLEQTSHPPTRYLVGKTHSNLNQRIGERAPLAQD